MVATAVVLAQLDGTAASVAASAPRPARVGRATVAAARRAAAGGAIIDWLRVQRSSPLNLTVQPPRWGHKYGVTCQQAAPASAPSERGAASETSTAARQAKLASHSRGLAALCGAVSSRQRQRSI